MSQGSKLEDFVTLHQFGPIKYVQLETEHICLCHVIMTVQLSISYFDTEEGLKHDIWRCGVIARVSYFLPFSICFIS